MENYFNLPEFYLLVQILKSFLDLLLFVLQLVAQH